MGGYMSGGCSGYDTFQDEAFSLVHIMTNSFLSKGGLLCTTL